MWISLWLMLAGAAQAAPVGGAPPPPDPRTIVAHAPCPETGFVRNLRRHVLYAEAGWNTLAGVGILYTRHLSARMALDAGLGLSGQMAKIGLRARANLSREPLTPFVGLGFLYGTGNTALRARDTTDRGNGISYTVDRSPFVQGSVGLAYTTLQGLGLLATLGWAQLLRQDNVTIRRGTPTRYQQERLRLTAGSGPSLGLALGYSF